MDDGVENGEWGCGRRGRRKEMKWTQKAFNHITTSFLFCLLLWLPFFREREREERGELLMQCHHGSPRKSLGSAALWRRNRESSRCFLKKLLCFLSHEILLQPSWKSAGKNDPIRVMFFVFSFFLHSPDFDPLCQLQSCYCFSIWMSSFTNRPWFPCFHLLPKICTQKDLFIHGTKLHHYWFQLNFSGPVGVQKNGKKTETKDDRRERDP